MQQIHVRKDYHLDVPDYGQHWPIEQLKDAVTRTGSHFFDKDTMRFFKSRVDYDTFAGPDGWYFVTSEKHESPFAGINEPRKYTVRRVSVRTMDDGTQDLWLEEYEKFQYFATLETARRHARKLAQTGCPKCPTCKYRLSLTGDCAECVEREQGRQRTQPTATAWTPR